MFNKYKLLVEHGISEMICHKIGDYVLVYGGNNFPDGPPPNGKKVIYNTMYLFDKDFNLVLSKTGNIYPNAGISVPDKDRIWYILGSTVYKIELVGQDIKESKFIELDFALNGGFACKYKDDLFFGSKSLYKLSIKEKKITELSEFPGAPRNQSVYCKNNNYLYIFGGASDICHMDAYKYNLETDEWHVLNDIPVSFTGSCSELYDENRLIIMGGFNKEVYDEAVKNLSDIKYKRNYFKKRREDYRWNKNYFIYNFETESFLRLEEDKESATCGAGLIKVGNALYLVGGELQPGVRNPYIYKTRFVLDSFNVTN